MQRESHLIQPPRGNEHAAAADPLLFFFLFGSNVALRGVCTCTPGVSGENTYLSNHAYRSQYQLGKLLCHQSRAFMIEGGTINTGKEELYVQIHVFMFNLPLKLAPRGPDSLL